MARKRSAKSKGTTRQGDRSIDLEAIGLVLLAAGASLAGLLAPSLPTGEIGAWTQRTLVGRLGWGAYALPWPALVLGGFFLVRRAPRGWPRVLLGYLLTATGAWALVMIVRPGAAGAWGVSARAVLTGAGGAAMILPAALLVTLGIEAMLAWRPTRIVRTLLRAAGRAARGAWRWAVRTRRALRERAAFQADVAQVRAAAARIGRDLDALMKLYPGSGEPRRWHDAIDEVRARLRGVSEEGLAEVRADVTTWRTAVDEFTAARADELIESLRAEGVREMEPWLKARHSDVAESVEDSGPAATALDGVRAALAFDLTALETRYRRLTRARDQAETTLSGVDVTGLVAASEAHAARRAAYKEIAAVTEALDADIERLESWRGLIIDLARLRADAPDVAEVGEYDATLAQELRDNGREALAQESAWREALAAVEGRAREAMRRAHRAALAGTGASREPAMDGTPELLGPEDVEGRVPVGVAAGEAEAGATPPFDATDQVAGGTAAGPGSPDRPAATREADDLPAVGGIPIQLPPIDLLDPLPPRGDDPEALRREVRERVRRIDETLANFNLEGRVVSSVRGPTVTRFEVEPAPGEKISRFANLADDLALAMAAGSVRIEAPILGKSVIGLEVPNADRDLIRFREAAASQVFTRARARLPLILGKSIDGEMVVADLAKMPHLLIAGSTGSGKSVAVNTLIASLIYKFLPTELRFVMIDPKMVELTPYDGIPHLVRPVVTDPKDAAGVLLGTVGHMERRVKMMSRVGAKSLDQYNEKARNLDLPQLPIVVIVIDELADLIMTSAKEVEAAVMRLAQMARATGMHLILATQRPSVNILTGLIKANVPARMAFAVSSGHDSRTILDSIGAERLIGSGDMLYREPRLFKPIRLQGPFVSEDEMGALAAFLRRQYFDDEFVEAYGDDFEPVATDDSTASGLIDWNDDKLRHAAELVIADGHASVSRLQRRLSVGHARAGKLMDSLEALGVVGPHVGSKPREVLVALEELPDIFGR